MTSALSEAKYSNLKGAVNVQAFDSYYSHLKYSNIEGQASVQFFDSKYTNLKYSIILGQQGVQFFDSQYTELKYSQILGASFTINLPPVVDNPIPDQQVVEGNLFQYTVPANTFSDPELDVLVLSATLADDSALPVWLSFNPITEEFFGIPPHAAIGTLNIKVTATDTFGGSVFDIFDLEILENVFEKTRLLIKSFRALMPKGRAWNIDLSVVFKQIIDAVASSAADVKDYFIGVKNDVFPSSTRSLELWEEQFLLDATGLNEQERRIKLAARWAEQGGQSPNYIEQQLLNLGIVAKVYENFNRDNPEGFLIGGDSEILVNGDIISEQRSFVNTCGDPQATCNSDNEVTAGEYDGFITTVKTYFVSVDSAKWVHYFIIADPADVNTPVDIPAELENSFKLLILRIKPVQTRAVLNVNYI